MVISSDCHAASNTDHRQPITDYSLVLGLAMSVVCGMSAGMSSSDLQGMANPELVELLGDQKWGDNAFGEVLRRLERNGYDDN
jgi:hypothetical protein